MRASEGSAQHRGRSFINIRLLRGVIVVLSPITGYPGIGVGVETHCQLQAPNQLQLQLQLQLQTCSEGETKMCTKVEFSLEEYATCL